MCSTTVKHEPKAPCFCRAHVASYQVQHKLRAGRCGVLQTHSPEASSVQHTALKAADILCAALADPHPGNIAVDAEGEGRLIYYDFGMMGTIPGDVREGLLELFYGVYQKDPDRRGPWLHELTL